MTPDESDWRLDRRQDRLKGAVLRWKRYHAPSATWDHDHCEFCYAKFMEVAGSEPDIQLDGYTTEDEDSWICKGCFDDFEKMFEFQVAGQVQNPSS